MAVSLYDYQIEAVKNMKNGCILCGGVGSGKSRTSLAYYFMVNGCYCWSRHFEPPTHLMDLYIITTARKRDTYEWDIDMSPFLMSTNPDLHHYDNKVIVDSWNNIAKYVDVENSFFILDEQRVVGDGKWTKSFLKIAKKNQWILLSATPGDCWKDYIPVFLANGFYRNKTEFIREHVVYSRFTKYPMIDRYINTGRLIRLRNRILVDMDFDRKTISHHEDLYADYDVMRYKMLMRDRWDFWKECPLESAGELCYALRRLVNSDESRILLLMELVEQHPRCIIFYNFDYELELLKAQYYGENTIVAEWNGHKHQPVPETDQWVYLVQYTAGCEGWNCIRTDTIIFYSQSYSYKVTEQASGRIDRLNTPFKDLYYYHLKSRSGIDLAIAKALKQKKEFNASRYIKD